MSRCLVTGGAGFIGSHVAEILLDEHDVFVLDDLSGGFVENVPHGLSAFPKFSICDADAVDELFDGYRFDYVYHLAAYAAEGLSPFIRRFNYENNVVGSANIINACVKHGVKCLVFTSSIAVYGHNQTPMHEGLIPRPCDPYGIAKYAVELDLKAAHDQFGLDYVIFRPHNVYGPRQNIADPYRNVVGIFMRQIMEGKPPTIFGDGSQTRAFSYIDDVAPLIAQAPFIPGAMRQTFNVGADQPVSVNELAGLVAMAMNANGTKSVHLPARNEVVHALANHDLVNRTFPAHDKTSIAVGLKKMADWVKSRPIPTPTQSPTIELEKNLPESWRALNAQATDLPQHDRQE